MLVLCSVVLSVLIAVPVAAIAARNQGRFADQAIRIVSTFGIGFPPFWLGLMLIILFSVEARYLPGLGLRQHIRRTSSRISSCPASPSRCRCRPCWPAACARRWSQALRSDVATAARARGMPESIVFWRHVLPNSLVPTVNLLAVNIGWLIGGTVVVETVFALPGMGQLLVRAIFSRDYMVVQGVAMVFACATVLVNFLADIAHGGARPEGETVSERLGRRSSPRRQTQPLPPPRHPGHRRCSSSASSSSWRLARR